MFPLGRNTMIAASAIAIVAAGAGWYAVSSLSGEKAQSDAGRGGMRAAPVYVAEVQNREFSTRIEALGTLEPKERVNLTATASDRVTAVYFEDGQRVKAGDTLIVLANAEERADMDAAQATLEEARAKLARSERLAADGAVSAQELEAARRDANNASAQVRAIQAQLGDRVLRAPFEGILGFRQVSEGAYVSPGQEVATLIDDSEMRLEFSVPSIYLSSLKPGLEIEARTDDLADRIFTGSLTSIDNAIDPATRSVKVRAMLPNEDSALKAGMFMTVDLMSATRTSPAIPELAVQAEGARTFVYVVDTAQDPVMPVAVDVKIGERRRGVVEVVEGLEPGDQVVTDGAMKIRPGMPVRVIGGHSAATSRMVGGSAAGSGRTGLSMQTGR